MKNRWIFVFGFEKNDRANVSPKELEVIKAVASDLLSLNANKIREAINNGFLIEVKHEKEK